jgi:radical SAM protein with 4Fe4S-binding SPASM domain
MSKALITRMKSRVWHLLPRKAINVLSIIGLAEYIPPLMVKPPLPTYAWIDPINRCNLKCPLCPTGSGRLKQDQSAMSFAVFKEIVDKVASLRNIELYNWGEPFLNPEIFDMIRYAKSRGITVGIHSNFSLQRNDEFFHSIIESGLDRLTISLDGARQESYEAYRRNGKFELVISNMSKLVKYRKQSGSATPEITWKFLINRFNADEVEAAKQMAAEIGVAFHVERFMVGESNPDMSYDVSLDERKQKWLLEDIDKYGTLRTTHDTACTFLFSTITVGPTGMIYPCCYVSDAKNAFGNILEESMEAIWHNNKFKYSRSLFTKGRYKGEAISTVCQSCRKFKKRSKDAL